jgi:hypothetical protein
VTTRCRGAAMGGSADVKSTGWGGVAAQQWIRSGAAAAAQQEGR